METTEVSAEGQGKKKKNKFAGKSSTLQILKEVSAHVDEKTKKSLELDKEKAKAIEAKAAQAEDRKKKRKQIKAGAINAVKDKIKT